MLMCTIFLRPITSLLVNKELVHSSKQLPKIILLYTVHVFLGECTDTVHVQLHGTPVQIYFDKHKVLKFSC